VQILLVDDDNDARKMVTAVLRAAGATVLPFDSAVTALEVIDERRPSIVITDIAMPEIDGYAFTRALRAKPHGRNVKVVALSAFPAAMEERNSFDAYLAKPIDPFRLIDEIARIALSATA
jgi:CheY-like chemotaxis protein